MKGTIRRRESGNWAWSFTVKEGGRRKVLSGGGFRLKKDAEAALRVALGEWDAGLLSTHRNRDLSLSDFLEQQWLPALIHLKPSTRKGYADLIRSYVQPHIGHVLLSELSDRHLARLYATLRTSGRRRGQGGVSENTVHHVHVVLSGALTHAVEARYLRVSPLVSLPKLDRPKVPTARREVPTWTTEDVRRFLEATRLSRWGSCWALALATGVRRSELIGLRWSDVDFEGARMSVRRARVGVGYEVVEGEPKNHRARVIALDPDTLAMLQRHRRSQLAERLAAGPAFLDSGGLVFTMPDGAPVHPQSVSWYFERAVKEAGLPRLSLHGCRHTHATLLLERGVPLKTVSERLGHSSISVTGDVYSHVSEHAQAQAIATIGAILQGGGR